MKRLIFMVLLLAWSCPLYAQKLDVELDMQRLEKGKIQTFEEEYAVDGEGRRKRVVGIMLLDAPPAVVWEVLADWDAMGPYVSGLDYYKTVHRIVPLSSAGGRALIEGKLSIPLVAAVYTLDVNFDRSQYRQGLVSAEEIGTYRKQGVELQDNTATLKNIEGYEYLEPFDDGKRCIYVYAPIVETAVPLPGFVERALSKTTLGGYMEGVRAMVAQRQAAAE